MEGKQLVPCSFGVSVHVDQDVDSILVDAISCLAIARDLEETAPGSVKTSTKCLFAASLRTSEPLSKWQSVWWCPAFKCLMDSQSL